MTKIKRIVSVVLVICMALTMPATVLQATAAEITSAQSISALAAGSSAALSEIEKAITSGTKDANGVYYAFEFPSKIKLGSNTIGAEEYTLMAASALYALSEGETGDTLIGYQEVSFRTDKAVCGSGTTVTKGQYLDLAMRAHDYGGTLSSLASSYNRPSDGTNTYNGRISVYSMAQIFAKALAGYAANGTLPESVTFTPTHPTNVTIVEPTVSTAAPTTAKPSATTATTAKPTTATTATTAKPTTATTAKPSTTAAATSSATSSSKSSLAIIALEAYQVEQWVLSNGSLPNYCTLDNGLVYNCPQMLYMWCKAVIDINGGKTTNTYSAGTINAPENPQGTATSGTIYLEEIIDMAERNYNWIGTNGQAPNYCTISTGTLQYENLVYFFARTMSFYHENGRLPEYCGVAIVEDTSGDSGSSDSGSSDSGSSSGTASSGDATFGNNFSSYSSYLKKTAYCHSTNATIISVAKTGMKYSSGTYGGYSNPSSTYQAMFNLFEYLNDKTHYDWYYDSDKGATGVWSSKYGNCCDMAHLMNACARSLGVPGRYVHGYCKFSSGTTTGHVWSEVCTNASSAKWYTADLVSDYNYLGYKTNTTLTLYNRYAELPF